MRFEPTTPESTAPSDVLRPGYDGGASAWPVLVRLPHVGAETDSRGPARPAADSTTPASRETSRDSRRWRIDPGEERGAPGRSNLRGGEPATVAERLYELHAAAAPHLGLVGVAALVLIGSLLFWLAFGPGRRPANQAPHWNLDQRWSSDEPAQAEAPDDEPAVAERNATGQPLEWPPAPRVADAAAAKSAPATTTPAGKVDPTSAAGPRGAIGPAAAARPTFDKGVANVAESEPITPTPHMSAYPITPYPVFWFDEQSAIGAPATAAEPMTMHGSSATR